MTLGTGSAKGAGRWREAISRWITETIAIGRACFDALQDLPQTSKSRLDIEAIIRKEL